MHRRPKTLWLVSSGLAATGLSLPLQVFWIYENDWDEIFSVLEKLTLPNWMVVVGSLLCASLVARASSWTRVALPLLIALVAVNNAIVGYYSINYSPLVANLATVGFLALNLPLLRPSVRAVFGESRRRWWKMAPRKRVSIPILLDSRAVTLRAETFDVSSTGAFIPWPMLDSMKSDLPIRVCMTLGEYRQLRCHARVVRRDCAKGRYPAGIGIQFEGLAWRQRMELQRYLGRVVEAT